MSDQCFGFVELKEILVDRIGVPELDIQDHPDLSFDDLGLDSLAIVELQLAVELGYGLVITAEDAHQITTLRSAIEYVNRKLAPAAPA
jgi:acyl carrier protein